MHISIAGSLQPLTMDGAWTPAIRHLRYGEPPSSQYQIYTFEQCRCEELVPLSITHICHPFAQYHVASLIIHHHVRLQFLELKSHLHIMRNNNTLHAMNNEQDIQFKQMKALVVYASSNNPSIYSYPKLIIWIIEHSLYLHTVTSERYGLNKCTRRSLERYTHFGVLDLYSKINRWWMINISL